VANSGGNTARNGHEYPQSGVEALIATVASRQYGLISLPQLYTLGVSYKQVLRLRRRRTLIDVHPNVYAVGHRAIGRDGRLFAALLACGPESFLSHRTAAGLWGLRSLNLYELEITVPGTWTKSIPGLILHRTSTPPARGEVSSFGGLRVSSPLRMLVDLAPRESDGELRRLIAEGVRRSKLDVGGLPGMIERHARRPGIASLRAAAERYLPRPADDSGFEASFTEYLESTPHIPEPERHVVIAGFSLDYFWVDLQAGVELDGRPYHTAVQDMDRDHIKSGRLAIASVRLLRITDWRWEHDRLGAIRDLHALLRLPWPHPKRS
jgi:hypothetical protein